MKKLARIFAPISCLTMGLTLRQMGLEFTDPKTWLLCVCMLINSACIAIEISD
jgi:predicted permease